MSIDARVWTGHCIAMTVLTSVVRLVVNSMESANGSTTMPLTGTKHTLNLVGGANRITDKMPIHAWVATNSEEGTNSSTGTSLAMGPIERAASSAGAALVLPVGPVGRAAPAEWDTGPVGSTTVRPRSVMACGIGVSLMT